MPRSSSSLSSWTPYAPDQCRACSVQPQVTTPQIVQRRAGRTNARTYGNRATRPSEQALQSIADRRRGGAAGTAPAALIAPLAGMDFLRFSGCKGGRRGVPFGSSLWPGIRQPRRELSMTARPQCGVEVRERLVEEHDIWSGASARASATRRCMPPDS